MRTLIDQTSEVAARFGRPLTSVPTNLDGDTPVPSNGLGRRLVERFALIAFSLYHLPLLLNNYPSLGGGGMSETGLAVSWGHVFTPPGIWIAHHVFHIAGPMPNGYRGDNGDVAEEFARLLLSVVIAALASVCWTWADRRRPGGRWVSDALKILLRFSIALGLTGYAIAKIFPLQFGRAIDPFSLERRLGDMSPMELLWRFMMYSRPYAFFGGLMELAVVLLLTFRRTATLGALLCLAVMTNVALLNYAYAVPVKLYSTMIVLSAAVLVIYDARRLWVVFVTHEAVSAEKRAPLYDRIPAWAQWTTKGLLVGSVIGSSVVTMKSSLQPRTGGATAAVDGTWMVTAFAADSTGPSANLAETRWLRLVVDNGGVMMRRADDTTLFCRAAGSSDLHVLLLTCAGKHGGDIRWSRTGDALLLSGRFDGTPVRVDARALHPAKDYRLLSRKFRWIDE